MAAHGGSTTTFQDKIEEFERDFEQRDGRKALLDWVHAHVHEWETDRNTAYMTRWQRIKKKWNES